MSTPYNPILVVEDIPSVRELLEITLRIKGYQVISASNGQEALECISSQPPSMVITDILMPKMDGFTLAHVIRKDPCTQNIPIVFLSATYVTPEDKHFAFDLGAVRFLEKPVDTEDFLLTVAEVLTTQDSDAQPAPMSETEFIQNYRERLEQKLRHKITQISRIERLLQSLPDSQKAAFELLLQQAMSDRDQIQVELDQLSKLM